MSFIPFWEGGRCGSCAQAFDPLLKSFGSCHSSPRKGTSLERHRTPRSRMSAISEVSPKFDDFDLWCDEKMDMRATEEETTTLLCKDEKQQQLPLRPSRMVFNPKPQLGVAGAGPRNPQPEPPTGNPKPEAQRWVSFISVFMKAIPATVDIKSSHRNQTPTPKIHEQHSSPFPLQSPFFATGLAQNPNGVLTTPSASEFDLYLQMLMEVMG